MVEVTRIGLQRLFDVRVLHHFWLDEGATIFDKIIDQVTKTQRLLQYDIRPLLSFQPSIATAATIAGLQGVFRTTGLGFFVAIPGTALVPLESVFEFFVTVVGRDYGTYTALSLARPGVTPDTTPSLRPQPTVTVIDPLPDPVTGNLRTLRYKANVPVLSNLTGMARGAGNTSRLFLSRDYPAASSDDAVEALVTVGDDLCQRIGDPPNAQCNVIGSKADLPIFVHQGDVPSTNPPAGSMGAPPFGIELNDTTPPNVTAVIRLVPRRPNDSPYNFAEPDGTPHPRVFEVHLQNRWTTWQYHNKSDGSLTSTEASPLPLTHFGNAGTKQKPSSAAIGADFDNQNPRRIIRLVSDIYV